MLLLALFVIGVVLFVEVSILVVLADAIGIFPVMAGTLVTFLFGLLLTRLERPTILFDIRDAWRQFRVPGVEATSAGLFFGGALMLAIPGIITDVLGAFLLIPPVRRAAARLVVRRFQSRIPWIPPRSRILGLPRGG